MDEARVERAVAVRNPDVVRRHVARTRRRNPDATPGQVIRRLEWQYVTESARFGAAAGGTAAADGSEVMVVDALHLSTLFVLSVAEVHGACTDEFEDRRALVRSVMLGKAGSAAIPKIAERTGKFWARKAVTKVPANTLDRINGVLGKNFVTKYGTKDGIVVLSRVAPYGIGAAIGGSTNAAMAALTVRACRREFGPPPASWPSEPTLGDNPAAED